MLWLLKLTSSADKENGSAGCSQGGHEWASRRSRKKTTCPMLRALMGKKTHGPAVPRSTMGLLRASLSFEIMPKRLNKPKEKPSSAQIAKGNRMAAALRAHHVRGEQANLDHEQDGALTTGTIARTSGVNNHTLRKDRDFAENFSKKDLEELCRRRRPVPSFLPLHWGYVPILLTAGSKTERRKFLRLAVREDWSVARLRREIQATRARVESNEETLPVGGRPLKPPKNVLEGWHQIGNELRVLVKRCQAQKRIAETGPDPDLSSHADLARRLKRRLQRLADEVQKALS